MLHAILEVFQFELRRSMTTARLVIWLVLAIFPTLLVGTISYQSKVEIPFEAIAFTMFMLIPMVGSLLGLLLWATPSIQSELEGNTWIYIAARPMGRIALLYGKYLTAVTWTLTATLVGTAGAILVSGLTDPWPLLRVIALLSCISSFCFGAVYLLFGVVILRRSMVLAFAYSLIFEGAISFIPATINKLTIHYRLRSLLADWLNLDQLKTRSGIIFGTEPASEHLFYLAVYAALALIAAGVIVRFREIPIQVES